jgi:phage baseplate assembly protein W
MSFQKFKFKNSGTNFKSRKFVSINKTMVTNVGIKTPLRSSGTTEIFDMHTDPREQLKDNLKNLILTNHGERLVSHNFGANLKSILYDFSKEKEYLEMVSKFIIEAAQKHIPVININDIQSVVLDREEKNNANLNGLAKLKVRVIFGIPNIRIENLSVQVEMFIGG